MTLSETVYLAPALPLALRNRPPTITGTALVVVTDAVAPRPRAPRRSVARQAGLLVAGAINSIAAIGLAAVAYSYAEQPWSRTATRAPAPVATTPSSTPSAQRPLETATLPEAPKPPVVEQAPTAAPAPLDDRKPADGTPGSANEQPPAPGPSPVAAPVEPPTQAHKPTASEAEYIARLDALLEPTRSLAVTVPDATHVRDAFAAGANIANARAHRDQITDPTAKKLIDWNLLRNGAGSGREIRAFLAANPDWANKDLLTQRAEEQVFMSGGTAKDIKAFFAESEPKTAIGLAALASAYFAEQDEPTAYKLASKAWRDGDIPATLENGFIERFGRLLTADDHQWRLDRLLLDDQRWEGDRSARAALIRRVIPFLSETERAKANARLAVFLRSPDTNKLMAALPVDAATVPKADWGFAFNLAQWHRRGGRSTESRAILLSAPTDPALAVSLDDWWEERRLAAYDALKAGEPKVAYDLVKAPGGPLGVNARKDAAFMAGWLALQHLSDAKSGERHFKELELAADGPLSRGRAGWWLAKTYEALGDTTAARASYERAAKNVDTFYGLMAMQVLEPGRTELKISPPALPSRDEAARFNARDAVKAIVIARRSGLDQSITRALLAGLRNAVATEQEHAMVAHLSEAIGDTQMTVRLAKSSVARGMNLLIYAYPVHAMPAYQPLRTPPEPAFLLGIARQESEFAQTTKSGAGAKGLLQVMTITANHVCKDYKIKCEIDRLMTDKAYNTMMGSAYLGDRMDEFTGSYVLTMAGYNAGPGRTRQWIREFGDPRDTNVDPIDWIHRIPFEETREYVQKVLANIQIYRARLGDEANALRITQDLRRVAPSSKRAAAAQGAQN